MGRTGMKDVGGAVLDGRSPLVALAHPSHDDDDVYYCIRWRVKLEGETENMGVCTKERKGATTNVLLTRSLPDSLSC